MDAREFRGLELAARSKIEWTGKHWLVPSQSHKGSYRIDADATTCTCKDFELEGKPCKHIHAVRFVKERNRSTVNEKQAWEDRYANSEEPKKPTYRQDWANYNKAQTNEKRLFLMLLADLCGTIPTPERKGRGRKPVSPSDAIFSAVYKVYSTFSGRRFTTDLCNAHEDGFITSAPCYNFVLSVLEDETTGPILKRLITDSSKPLKAVESSFSIDSSGFSTNRFGRWYDTKYGVDRTKAEWVKCHVCIGTRTNVVTAVEIGNDHDGQMFPVLLNDTAKNFTLGNISADKAYLSRENLELVDRHHAKSYIPFKINSRGDKNGDVWEKAFHLFSLHRDEFCKHYHQRSNVESTFSMIKRKFGDNLRSKTPTALHNEVLAKVLCHNIVVLIHEMYELGISPEFAGDKIIEREEADEPRILKFPSIA